MSHAAPDNATTNNAATSSTETGEGATLLGREIEAKSYRGPGFGRTQEGRPTFVRSGHLVRDQKGTPILSVAGFVGGTMQQIERAEEVARRLNEHEHLYHLCGETLDKLTQIVNYFDLQGDKEYVAGLREEFEAILERCKFYQSKPL